MTETVNMAALRFEPRRRSRLARGALAALLAALLVSPLLVLLPSVRAELLVLVLEHSEEDGRTADRCRRRLLRLGPQAVPALIRFVRREQRSEETVMGRGERALVSIAFRSPEAHRSLCAAIEAGLDVRSSVRILTQHLGSAETPAGSVEARRRAVRALRRRLRRSPPGGPEEAMLVRGLIELKPGIAGLHPRLPQAIASRPVAISETPSSDLLSTGARLDTILASLGRALGSDLEVEEDFYTRSGLTPEFEVSLFHARSAGEVLHSIAASLPSSSLVTGVDNPWLRESDVREGLPLCFERRGDRLRVISLKTAIKRLRDNVGPEVQGAAGER